MSFQRSTFTVVIPIYNAELFLGRTLASWAQQERLPEQMILVDNASTNQSLQVARDFAREFGRLMKIQILHEANPGKVRALELAQKYLETEWVVLCDADTWYPPHYLKAAERRIENSSKHVVAIMAIDVKASPDQDHMSRQKIRLKLLAARLFPRKCHTRGFGQILRVSALREAGGFSAERWGFVLMDHEIMERLHRLGGSLYGWPYPLLGALEFRLFVWCMDVNSFAITSRI